MHQADQTASLTTCYAHVEDGLVVVVGNAHVERAWAMRDGQVRTVRLLDKRTGRQWVKPETTAALPSDVPTVRITPISDHPVTRPYVDVQVDWPTIRRSVRLFPDSPAVTMQPPGRPVRVVKSTGDDPTSAVEIAPSGIETDAPARTASAHLADAVDAFEIDAHHLRLVAVTLNDQTDHHDNLAFEREWLLHPSESPIELAGNLFVLEDVLTGDGLIVLKPIPLPHARPVKAAIDLRAHRRSISVHGTGMDADAPAGDPVVVIPYAGGRFGRIRAMHDYQRQVRPVVPGRDGRFVSNTWGDRSRDARIREDFLMKEIDAGRQLGVEVIQIDDGWQRGRTANSAEKGGVWNGFWAADDRFWDPHPERLPNGLAPLVAHARASGMGIGLWYAPDSSNDFANWRRDAEQVLSLHRAHGITSFKIDGVKMHSTRGAANLRRFYDHVQRGSNGQVVFDHDVTAEVRPSYFGVLDIGTLFVENRYTDWRSYWPHHTLRNLWTLAHYVDPARLRIEFLNNARHATTYGDDPLAPACYSPDYLFATTMFASPLGWFELTGLPADYVEKVAPLVATWKQHRDAIFAGTILPVGPAPDGTQVTGFVSRSSDGAGGYALIFRERSTADELVIDLSALDLHPRAPVTLAGNGTARLDGSRLRVTVPSPMRYALIQL